VLSAALKNSLFAERADSSENGDRHAQKLADESSQKLGRWQFQTAKSFGPDKSYSQTQKVQRSYAQT
jgi:hypothetical protein